LRVSRREAITAREDVDGPVTVVGDDPHNLDGNHDGMACEGP
jgi:hypothetical protein